MSKTNDSYWQTLLPAAMVGTDKMAFSSPALSGPVGALLAQIQAQATSPTLALLQTAGVLAVCERAARQGTARAAPATNVVPDTAAAPAPDAAAPGTTPAANTAALESTPGSNATAPGNAPAGNTAAPKNAPAPNIAAPETAPALTSKSLQISLRWALTDAPLRLQIELLHCLSAAEFRLPHSLLPLALDAGLRSVALRPALLAVLGERGRWLARQNTAWRYAEGAAADAPLETRWSDGSLAQRVELLRSERQRDPASARDRLKTALPDLPAKERAELAAVLIEGLSIDDEALLTALCKDRGGDVRQTARALLVQLPGSATTQRAIARLLPCLEKQSTLKSLLGAKWKIDAPQAVGDDWKADGLEAERPKHDSLGERGWWLYQLARQVPLIWWVEHTGMTPAALLQWAAKTDWKDAVARAWLDVLRTAPSAAWCQAFLDHWPGKAVRENPAAILTLLPPAQREPYWIQALQAKEAIHASFIEVAGQIVQACPPGAHVSRPLSTLLINTLQDCMRDTTVMPRHAYEFSTHLPELCCVLHPGALPAWQTLQRLDNEPSWLINGLDRCLQPVAARLAFATLAPASATHANPINPIAP
jgi:hypothetical protein